MSQPSTFKVVISVPREVSLQGDHPIDRDDFFGWLWNRFENEGLIGVHEGTLLCEQAAEEGFETDSWTVDSAEAPKERDWVGHQVRATAELYFSKETEAVKACFILKEIPDLSIGPVEEEKVQDWDAEWKASFLNAGDGVKIPPFWRIVPPWRSESKEVHVLA